MSADVAIMNEHLAAAAAAAAAWCDVPCQERIVSQSVCRITCSGSDDRMSSGGSFVPRIASRLIAAAAACLLG